MLAILLYLVTSVTLIALWRRYVHPMSNAAALVLFLLPFCFTGRALLTGRVYAPIDMPLLAEPHRDYKADYGLEEPHNGTLSDLYMQMIPWQSAVRQSLARGEWPLWNRHMLAGSILASNMQAAPYDPLQLLGFLIPHPQALTFGAAMNFFIAALFTFGFLRALGMSETASLVGAAAYMFNAVLAFFIGWPIGRAWTFLPLVLLGVRLVVREAGLRAAVVLTLGFVLLIFSGHPETMLHVVFTGVIYGVYELIMRWREGPAVEGRRALARSVGLAVLCGVLALMLTAISLLPFLSAAPQTVEYYVRHELYAKAPFDIPAAAIAKRAGLSLFPFYGGQPERDNFTSLWEPTSMRVGSVALALALVALFSARRRHHTWFFFGLALFAACAGLNAFPVGPLLHALPLFDITLNERLAFVACFALAALAALAVDAWEGKNRPAAAIVAALAIALAVGTALIRDSQIAAGVDPDIIILLSLAELLPLAALAGMFALGTPARVALPLILGLMLLQRTIEDGSIYPAHPEKWFYPDVPIIQRIQQDPATPFRIVGLQYAFLPDAAALYGLEDARGYEAMTFLPLYETYSLWCTHEDVSFNRVYDKTRPFLSMINVKYAIGSTDAQPDAQWKLVLEDRQSRLLENQWVLPRAFIPRRIRYEPTRNGALVGMSKTTDFAELGFISTTKYKAHEIHNGPGTLTIRRDHVNYDIDATMDLDGWVILTESRWPGWRAYVDGKRVETQIANHAFIGVFVPKGKHHLRLVYVPESFTRGRNISFGTAAALVGLFVVRWRKLRVPRPSP